MEDVVSSPPLPTPSRKRPAPEDESPGKKALNLKGTQFMMPTPPDTEESSNASPTTSNNPGVENRAVSPAPSCSTLSTAPTSVEPLSNVPASSSTAAVAISSSGPPAKRRKLTPSEKIEQQELKEAKERERAEKRAQREVDKVRKEEEKARKDEEKARRDEEKRVKAEEKEAKKREKEYEEERKNEEKLKKERSQMRLGVFFQPKPGTPVKSSDRVEGQPVMARRRSLSLEPFDAVADQIRKSMSPMKGAPQQPTSANKPQSISTPAKSDYRKTFLPFQLPSHSTMARPDTIAQDLYAAEAAFDSELNDPSLREKYDLSLTSSYANLEHYFGTIGERGTRYPSVEQLAGMIHGTAKQPIDLTTDANSETPLQQLQKIQVKHIHFHEDVRPAYSGTYSKIRSSPAVIKMRRNPFTRGRPDTNYDYDSEAEWEEPEEGDEEIVSDDDDESDKDGDGDEIDEFLDDEDDVKPKRKFISGDLVPECTGLCWADENGRSVVPHNCVVDMRGMRMDFLIPGYAGATIDPFSTEYWQADAGTGSKNNVPVDSASGAFGALMAPPRPPLQPRPNSNGPALEVNLLGAAEGEKGPITSVAASHGAKRGSKPAPKTLSKEDLEEFKEAVVGSPLGKLDLLKGLKSRFPKLTHETIKETLGTNFAQVGLTKADKKWVYVGTA